jgi:hypothetical protein
MSDGVGCATKSHAKARRREEEWALGVSFASFGRSRLLGGFVAWRLLLWCSLRGTTGKQSHQAAKPQRGKCGGEGASGHVGLGVGGVRLLFAAFAASRETRSGDRCAWADAQPHGRVGSGFFLRSLSIVAAAGAERKLTRRREDAKKSGRSVLLSLPSAGPSSLAASRLGGFCSGVPFFGKMGETKPQSRKASKGEVRRGGREWTRRVGGGWSPAPLRGLRGFA